MTVLLPNGDGVVAVPCISYSHKFAWCYAVQGVLCGVSPVSKPCLVPGGRQFSMGNHLAWVLSPCCATKSRGSPGHLLYDSERHISV